MSSLRPAARGTAPLRRRNRLVHSSQHLIRPLALHYSRCTGECSDDLLQVAQLGLIRAAELYEGCRDTPFDAFARPHIRGAILHHLRDVAPLVRLPRRQAELQEKIGRLQSGPEHSRPDLAALGISAETWHLLQRHRCLNRPLPLEPELLDTLPQERLTDLESIDGAVGRSGSLPAVVELLEQLEPRQRQVIQAVVLAGESYRQVGKRLRVSPMTVRRYLQAGLEALRQELTRSKPSVNQPRRLRRDPSDVEGW